ncbi:MBL fold metallo-hydrolase [Yoonia sp. R2331]|uniref:MBL fold metallo-hydrolase n=1 Tax=Yoonia sp. R2331 TaxID=3237238 RepID=UPI0034E3FA9F
MNLTTLIDRPETQPAPSIRHSHFDFATSLNLAEGFQRFSDPSADRSFQSMLQQFEIVLSYGKVTDPRVILQAMNFYLVSEQQKFGIELFTEILAQYAGTMEPQTLAIYESALGVLRATYADHVPLMRRISWVKASFDLIEGALKRTAHEHPVPHWAAGMVYAQVPGFFFKKSDAIKHLTWLAERPETEPTFGFYREVYRQLAALTNDPKAGKEWLRLSGYGVQQPQAPLIGWFTTGPEGTTMSPRPVLDEVVEGRIFALYGFGFSDVFFVLSDDGKELIAVDAGTQPHSLKAAHDLLLAAHPNLPNITTALITHAHWDHVGGHQYLREHNPDIAIYGSANFATVTERVNRDHSYSFFRGANFDHTWVESYAPTHPISAPETLTIGGTDISLIPVTGGETEDAMLIHIKGLETVFVGDVVMPWYGEPWVNEGFVSTATDTMDRVIALEATHVLHGHFPLTVLYGGENLQVYRRMHKWLVDTAESFVRNGYSAKDIIRLNLVPSDLATHPEAALAYAAARDNVIARVADQMVGIWREDRTGQSPEGLDTITTVERARLLKDYLGLNEAQVAKGLRRMIAAGDNELALQMAVAAEQAFGTAPRITESKGAAIDRLRSVAQFTDPFRFTAYSEIIDCPHPAMPAPLHQTQGTRS